MTSSRALLLALLVVPAPAWAQGQPTAAGPAPAAVKETARFDGPFSVDRYGSAEGLPQTSVRAIVQDDAGFLWFGTQEGLVRYDGIKMQVFRADAKDEATVSGGYITALETDKSGKVWVGTAENGANLYDPNTDKFTRFHADANNTSALSSEGITDIHRDKKDRIWLAMADGGLNQFVPESKTFKQFTEAPLDVAIAAIAEDGEGNLWLGTATGALIRFNPDNATAKAFSAVSEAGVAAVKVDSKGLVWIGTNGDGAHVLDPTRGNFVAYHHDQGDPKSLSHDAVTAFLEDRLGDLWIGTQNGLSRFDRGTRKFISYRHDTGDPQSLGGTWVQVLYEDKGGQIWAGHFVGGLSKFDRLRLNLGYHRTAASPAVAFYEEKPGGTLWVGTYHAGLYKYDRAARKVTRYHSLGEPGDARSVDLSTGWISSIHRDKNGILWFALVGHGLIAFDPGSENFEQFTPNPDEQDSLPSETIWDIWEDDKANLWLATFGSGLVRFDPDGTGKQFKVFISEETKGLSSNDLYTLYPDPEAKNLLWIATSKGGLVQFDVTSGTAINFRHRADDPNSLATDDVVSVYREPGKNGVLWVGTHGGGLNRLEPETGRVERFQSTNSGLTNDVIWGILPDDAGKLWLSTNGGGLIRFDPAAKKFDAFRARDGAQSDEYGQGGFMKSKSGELFFGGISGFNSFQPRDIDTDKYVPPVVLTGFKRLNVAGQLDKPIWTLPSLDLSYSDSFEISFAALSFADPKRNRFAYKLEGFDENWIETDRAFAPYTKLDGGDYTLLVRASNRHGVWSEQPVKLAIHVAMPLWRTPYAYGAYALVLGLAVFGVIRFQRNKIRRLEREGRLAAVERDLELTGAIQEGFLPPSSTIRSDSLQLYGFYRPADACGGDWWWHEQPIRGTHLILVGDVTGHGPGPAMVTAAVATAFRVMAGETKNLPSRLDVLNKEVLRVGGGKYQMTLAAIEIDERDGRYAFYSAGAPPMLRLSKHAKPRFTPCPGWPLGTEGFQPQILHGQFEPGERVLVYTDGIPELQLPNGKLLGMRKFSQICANTRPMRLTDACLAIVQEADKARQGASQTDDWTFAMIEWKE